MTVGTSSRRAFLTFLVLAPLAIAWPTIPSSAQIYEWVGDDDVRNYTSSLEEVPEGARSQARVLVEGPTSEVEDGLPMSREPRPREAQAAADPPVPSTEEALSVARKRVSRERASRKRRYRDDSDGEELDDEEFTELSNRAELAFEEGWALGLQAGLEQCRALCPVEQPIYLLPPPYVPQAPPYDPYVPFYDPYAEYYVSPYEGTVTAPFDGGRSRGLTRRQQQGSGAAAR